jgi:putative transposase
MIEPEHKVSIAVQCQLLDVAHSSYYYESTNNESEANLAVMARIDELYLAHPENGSRMMVRVLRRSGCEVNRKRVVHSVMEPIGFAVPTLFV